MSVEAITWALNNTEIPEGDGASSLAMILVGLANHANPDGRHAFPSIATLMRYSRLSRSTVIRCLTKLKELGLIVEGNQAIAAAHIDRVDHRPTVYDLQLERGVITTPRQPQRGVTEAPNGVSQKPERGVMVTPEPYLNQKINLKTPAADATEPLELDLPLPADLEKDAEDEKVPETLTLNQRSVQAAQWYYRKLGNMGKVPAFQAIIKRAMENGHSDAQIKIALTFIADHHWTLTQERLAHALNGGPQPASKVPVKRKIYLPGRNGRPGMELERG